MWAICIQTAPAAPDSEAGRPTEGGGPDCDTDTGAEKTSGRETSSRT